MTHGGFAEKYGVPISYIKRMVEEGRVEYDANRKIVEGSLIRAMIKYPYAGRSVDTITTSEFAERAGVSIPTVWRWKKNGHIKGPYGRVRISDLSKVENMTKLDAPSISRSGRRVGSRMPNYDFLKEGYR